MAAPKIWLKQGHSLLSKDVLPVVLRLRELKANPPAELAGLTKTHALESYSSQQLAAEFESMTGYKLPVSSFP